MGRIIVSLLFLLISINAYSNTISLDIRSSKSSITLIPDSIIIMNKSNNAYYKFYGTSTFDLNTITSTEVYNSINSPVDELNIYTFDGRLIKSFHLRDYTDISYSLKFVSNLHSGLFFIECLRHKIIVKRKIIYLDASGINISGVSPILSDNRFNVYVYKHGYRDVVINDLDINDIGTTSILMDPEYDKYYNSVSLIVNGIYKTGKVDSESVINGNTKYSTWESHMEFDDTLFIKNTETRVLSNACSEMVMGDKYKEYTCDTNFPIELDSVYFCDLECNQGSYLSDFKGISLNIVFNDGMDTIRNFSLQYSDGTYENAGNPSYQQHYRDFFFDFKGIPVVEKDDRFIVTLNKSEIEKYLTIFNWDTYYSGISINPPFDSNKSSTHYTNENEIMPDAVVTIEIRKSQ